VNAELIDEFLETSNESYEFIQHSSDFNNNINNDNNNNNKNTDFMDLNQTDNKINNILCNEFTDKENKLKDNHVSSCRDTARINNLDNRTSLSSINTIIKVVYKEKKTKKKSLFKINLVII
jgi:hypothetical protein